MLYLQFILISAFLFFNTWIVLADIRERKIPNTLLIGLLIVLPIWYIVFPIREISEVTVYAVMSLILFIGGIGAYTENGFLGSGDIKYASIMVLYLAPHSLPLYIGNVGGITIIILILWLSFLMGQIYAMRTLIVRSDWIEIFPMLGWLQKKQNNIGLISKKIGGNIGNFIFDWCVIGFFLYMALKSISVWIFSLGDLDTDFYFLLTLLIFLIRPMLRYMLTEWEHRIYPILGMILYYGVYIRDIGIKNIGIELGGYIVGIWQYALAFILLQILANTVFGLYARVLKNSGYQKKYATLPYSIVIFAGFATLVWGGWDIMTLLKEGL